MKITVPPFLKPLPARLLAWMGVAFDRTADWVTQLSWFKFLLFAALLLISGGILEKTLFSNNSEFIVMDDEKSPHRGKHPAPKSTVIRDGDAQITINEDGIHIVKSKEKASNPPATADGALPATPPAAGIPPAPPLPPAPPMPPASPNPPLPETPLPADDKPKPGVKIGGNGDIHIRLPPEIGEEVRDAIDDAVDDAAEAKVATYRKQSSTWFTNFVLLLVLGLFGTKALMGGKKRAEARASAANASAEREALQRQVSEAKMQMMQAQVEPHFLFNTLASVEHLIETDPPRASAMQRSLIQYLRAVLPQIRDTTVVTNLGREADMVQAYLALLKMRMEERLRIEFHVPEGLRSAAFPPMMLQSLVENAIKHGLECKPEGGTIRVMAEVAHNKLRVTVADDGMGFGAVKSDGTGTGLQNIRERLKLLHKDNGHLTIAGNQPTGVSATIEVPYQLAA